MRYRLFDVHFLICWLFSLPLLAQFTYTLDQTIPTEVNGILLKNPWAGGLNAAQINTMDLNEDGTPDLVLFDKTTSRISTFLTDNGSYRYAPEFEPLFPSELSTFVLLRDYNCDGRKDIFTFGQIGILVFQNSSQPGKPLSWKKLSFFNSSTRLYSEVLLTKGFSGKINLLPGSNDMPDFTDMDGDGDLDVLNMRFVNPSTAEYHRNFSMERYGRCDSLDLERQTSSWGGFLECSCGKIAFNGQTCADIGGREIEARAEHTGGKVLLTFDADNDGDKDLLFSEESCSRIYYMENHGSASTPLLDGLSIYPPNNPVGILSYPAPYLEDVDHDGTKDLLVSPNIYNRESLYNNFRESIWFFKNTGSNQLPNFVYQKDNFLQEDMIEVGDFSAPAFTDIDLDGDEDLFVGNYVDPVRVRSTISYYQNIGSPSAPSFRLVTDDYAGLSLFALQNIKPQFVDIDKNGAPDLVFTANKNGIAALYYVLSRSSTAPSFLGQAINSLTVTIGLNESAHMVDVDQDGHPDILIGKSTGSLQYWRNTGSGNTFFLSNSAFLGLGSSTVRQFLSAATGDLDADGRDDLLLGDYVGKLVIYSDFRTAGSNAQPITGLIYDPFSKSYNSRNLGGSTKPAITHVLGLDKPEIMVGNRQGGCIF